MAGLLPRDRFLVRGPKQTHRRSDDRPVEVALTFDDGPHPEWTPTVLDVLAEADWRGTFFVVGERAARHPELVRRIASEGHAIGNHTETHAPPAAINATAFLEEVYRTRALIQRLTGNSSDLVRPPLGKLTWRKLIGLWRARQSVVLWNVDPRDFSMRTGVDARRWGASYIPRGGDIVLLHDRLPFAAEIVRTIAQRHGEAVRSVSLTQWVRGIAPARDLCNGRLS